MRNKKGQVSIQFLTALSFVFIFFIILFVGITIRNQEEFDSKKHVYLRDFSYYLKEEINLAIKTENGYKREIIIPDKINSMNYSISKVDNYIVLKSEDEDFSIRLPNFEGDFKKGSNIIRKVGGKIVVTN